MDRPLDEYIGLLIHSISHIYRAGDWAASVWAKDKQGQLSAVFESKAQNKKFHLIDKGYDADDDVHKFQAENDRGESIEFRIRSYR